LLLKFSALSLGAAITNTGGKLSLGPPVGGMIFAHPVMPGKRSNMMPISSKERKVFMCFATVQT